MEKGILFSKKEATIFFFFCEIGGTDKALISKIKMLFWVSVMDAGSLDYSLSFI